MKSAGEDTDASVWRVGDVGDGRNCIDVSIARMNAYMVRSSVRPARGTARLILRGDVSIPRGSLGMFGGILDLSLDDNLGDETSSLLVLDREGVDLDLPLNKWNATADEMSAARNRDSILAFLGSRLLDKMPSLLMI